MKLESSASAANHVAPLVVSSSHTPSKTDEAQRLPKWLAGCPLIVRFRSSARASIRKPKPHSNIAIGPMTATISRQNTEVRKNRRVAATGRSRALGTLRIRHQRRNHGGTGHFEQRASRQAT